MERRKLPDFVSTLFRTFSRPPVAAPLDLARQLGLQGAALVGNS
jgi:hypothetical protein